MLQQEGVYQVHYFCTNNGIFGLFDYHFTKTAPNYQLFYLMTNVMGRERVEASTDHDAIGVIATRQDHGEYALMLYNRANAPVKVLVPNFSSDYSYRVYDYSYEWYVKNHMITDGVPPVVSGQTVLVDHKDVTEWTVPALGVLVLVNETGSKL